VCIWLLAESPLDGVTDALVTHAFAIEGKGTEDMGATEHYLREALNKRLKTSFKGLEELCKYLRASKKGKKAAR
jgi:hypothetical protein